MIVSSINNQLNTNYEHLSKMKRINSSSGGADLLIAERLIGVSSNSLDNLFYNHQYTSPNLKSERSPIENLDVPSYLSDMNENRILNVYRLFVQSSKTEQATRGISILLESSS